MTLTQQVQAQALLLAGELDIQQNALLEVLCDAAVTSLTARLKESFRPEDCKAPFVAAASLYALSALNETDEKLAVEEFKAGDLTVKQGRKKDAASRCLQRQAEMMIGPYLKDRFCFAGV